MNDLNETIRSLFGEKVTVERRTPVSGGDINRAYALQLSDGRKLFMKANSRGNEDFFRAESEGLAAIRRTGAVRVPDEIARGTKDNEAFLLLEYISGAKQIKDYWETFAAELAAMHRADVGGKYGFPQDNWIGSGKRRNYRRA